MMARTPISRITAPILAVFLAGVTLAQPPTTERRLTGAGEWTITEQPVMGTAERELADARRTLAERRYEQAHRLADEWIERHPNHSLTAEALLVRGDSLFLQREYYKSLYDYEEIVRKHYGSEAYPLALEREFQVATLFASGVKRKMWGLRWANADAEAEEILIRIQERSPGSKLAERAGRALADFYFQRRQMDLASIAYDVYIDKHPTAADRAEAMKRLVFSHLATFRGPEFDPAGLYEARAWLERLQARYPSEAAQIGASALQNRIDESDADQMLELARWYLGQDDPVSAKFMLRRLLRRYPDSVAAGVAYDLMRERDWIETDSTPGPETTEGEADDESPASAQLDSESESPGGGEERDDDDG